MKTLRIKVVFTEEVLGSLPSQKDIYSEFVASKAPSTELIGEEEAAHTVDEGIAKGTTVFARDEEGNPCFYDYAIKGFFKDVAGMLRRAPGTLSSRLTAHKKVIDGLIFPSPRLIRINPAGAISLCQRPLRAQAGTHEATALASSESLPAGSSIEFELMLLKDDLEPLVREWLDYGRLRGLGQWRNSGKGRFVCEYGEGNE
jgi:hypothetical protein